MSDKETIGQRLRWLLDDQKKGVYDFAETIKVDGSQFGKVVNDKLGITLNQIQEISSVYKVRVGWLIEGELPVYKKESGSFEPDIDLLTKIKKQVDELKINFDTLFEPTMGQSKETSNLGYPNVDFVKGTRRKAGKQ